MEAVCEWWMDGRMEKNKKTKTIYLQVAQQGHGPLTRAPRQVKPDLPCHFWTRLGMLLLRAQVRGRSFMGNL